MRNKTLQERRAVIFNKIGGETVAQKRGEAQSDTTTLDLGGLAVENADLMIENAIGVYSLPLGIATNFQVNGIDYLVPMVIEEPSVIAAASNGAKMALKGGGFSAIASDPIMTAQIELLGVGAPDAVKETMNAYRCEILKEADALLPNLIKYGGRVTGFEVRSLKEYGHLVVHFYINCGNSMGANSVNTFAEKMAPILIPYTGGKAGLKVLTNLCDRRTVMVFSTVPLENLATKKMSGKKVAAAIATACDFAAADPYRAATHNKGIMNGVDAVVMATGNDWRAVEAGAHAWAARNGSYKPLSKWTLGEGCLMGQLQMPMAIGTVHKSLKLHQGTQLALRILDVKNAPQLAAVIGSVGLACNLAALKALVTDGIQKGHMALHSKK